MWKVCQLLKGGRSHISRSRNANTLPSPGHQQPSSSSAPFFEEEKTFEQEKKCRIVRRPLAFTPSAFRAHFEQNQRQQGDQSIGRIRLFSLDEENTTNAESASDEEDFGQRNQYRRRRPDHDHDRWDCRCRCRFGDWFGYTTMVAATIHLSRVTVHLLPNNNERLEIRRDDDHRSILSDFKEAVQSGWRRFVCRAAPVFLPDLFKRWYVLPPKRSHQILPPTNLRISENIENSTENEIFGQELLRYDSISSSSSSNSNSSPTSRTRSTSDDCAVQTDDCGLGTPFDDLVYDSGRRLAAYTRLTDVGLEHAIGVDFLKRRLYDEAVDYLLGAARSGHSGALYNLGVCYSRGFGVRRDLSKAVEMWRAAADQGHGLSKYQMGACHARGLGGLAMDYDRALRYMEAAASIGVPEAKTYLAAHEYKQGRLEGALELLRQAVAGGDDKAHDLIRDWPDGKKDDIRQRRDKSNDGYTFASLTKEKSKSPVSTTKRISSTNNGRRRFWASSSSEKEDSLATSSSSSLDGHDDIDGSNRSSSVVFCDETSSSEGVDLKSGGKAIGERAVETVAAILTFGTLRRSKTAPAEFRGYDNFELALATTTTTGNVEEINQV